MKTCGLRRAFAAGGIPDRSWMTDGQKSMLADYESRVAKQSSAMNPPQTLAQDTLAAQQQIEGVGNQTKFDALKAQADNLSGISGSGLSQRQKANAMSTLQGEASKMGMQLDTGFQPAGLSNRQKLSLDMGNLTHNANVVDFGVKQQKDNLTAQLADARWNQQRGYAAGYAKGGTVDSKGFIHGEKGVDKVAAEVAETGEPIRVGDGERIVNKEQNAALEKLTAAHGVDLDDYLEEATGEPVGPTMKKGLRAADGGWSVANKPDAYNKAVSDLVATPKVTLGAGKPPTIYENGGLPADVVEKGITKMRAQLNAAKPDPDRPTDPDTDGRRVYSTPTAPSFTYRAPETPSPAQVADSHSDESDRGEALRDAALSGGASLAPRNDKSMAYLRSMGVDTTMRFDPRDDVNTVNGNGPERVKGGAVTTINTQNGPVYAGRDKKGQLVVTSGLDRAPEEQAAATKSGYDQAVAQAAKDKVDLRQMQRDRFVRDTGSDITDPEVKRNAAFQLARMDKEDAAAQLAAQHKEEVGLRKGMLDLHAEQLAQNDRHFKETLKAQQAVAAAAAKKEGVADFDKLVSEAGFDKDEAVKFKDWFRGNYAGRKQKIGDQMVDVPGFEDMSADERRAHMTNAKALYALTKQLNGTEMKGRTSMAVPKRLVERDLTFDDVRRHQSGLLAGFPVLHSDDPNAPGLIGEGGLVNRLWVPEMLGGKNKRVVEEVDENGKGLRRWLRYNTRGEMGPWGNQDTAAYINDITTQK